MLITRTPPQAGRAVFSPRGAKLALDFTVRTASVMGRQAPLAEWLPDDCLPLLTDQGLAIPQKGGDAFIDDMPFRQSGTLLLEIGRREDGPPSVCLASFVENTGRSNALYLHRNGDLEMTGTGGGMAIDGMTLPKALLPECAGTVLFAFGPNVWSLSAQGRACMAEPRYGGTCSGRLWLGSNGGEAPYLCGTIRRLACFDHALDMPRMNNFSLNG